MTIIDKIARTIERPELNDNNNPLPFVYEDRDVQNIVLDQAQTPFAAAVPITSGVVTDERGEYHDQITLAVFFGQPMAFPETDYNARANECIIDQCKRRAFMWLASLQGNAEVELVSVNASERWYLEDDSICTGYVLNVTLQEVEGIGKCAWRAVEQ